MKMIFKDIPEMICEKNCGLCCGIVAVTKEEYGFVQAYIAKHGITPQRQGSTCPFYQAGVCAVYPARPSTCILFGHVPEMQCPKGHSTLVIGDPNKYWRWMSNRAKFKDLKSLHMLAGYSSEEITELLSPEIIKTSEMLKDGRDRDLILSLLSHRLT
jgi:Fe-S-cluster containining protein